MTNYPPGDSSSVSSLPPATPAVAAGSALVAGRWVQIVGLAVFVAISLAMAGLVARVVQLQTRPSPQVAALMGSQQGQTELLARRGAILDRQGRDLAPADSYHRLYVDPKLIRDPSTFAERLGRAVGYDPAAIDRRIAARPRSRFVVLDQQLTPERLEAVRALQARELGLDLRMRRQYPMGPLAGQTLGFVGFDGKGMEGIEKVLDATLRGTPGKLVALRDASHNPLAVQEYQPPVDGRPVRISIDATIQAIAERELAEACRQYGAKSAEMVILHPVSGEILAMANWPPFDPNQAGRARPDDWRNRCVTDFFEPGSIFKPVVWSAATQMGYARPNENIDCGPGVAVMASGRRLHDAHGNGLQTWDGVLVKSSNIGMGKVGQRMGPEPMNRALRAFGMGYRPNTGLPGESPGMVNQLRRWNSYSITSIPMGQEVGVTPLQITRAFGVFANGGWLIRPTLHATPDPARPAVGQVLHQVLSPDVAQHTRQVLRRVVTEGTGRKAQSKLYQVWGKTGTAQIPAPRGAGYIPGAYIGSFVGGAPLEHPQVVIGCFIHRPDPAKGYYGGIIAAPTVRDVIDQVLPYLGVTPDLSPQDQPAGRNARQVAHIDTRD